MASGLRPKSSLRGAVFAVLLCRSAPSAAEPSVSVGLRPAPAGDGALLVSAPEARGASLFRLRVLGEYAREPLVLVTPAQRTHRVVREQIWTHLGASYAIAHRALIHATLPLVLVSRGDRTPDATGTAAPAAGGTAVGDARLGGRVRVLGATPLATKLGLGFELSLPTGDAESYAGAGSFGARGYVSAGAEHADWVGQAELGFSAREGMRLPGVLPTRVGSSLDAGIALRVPLDTRGAWRIGPELTGAFGVGAGASWFDPRSTLVHVLLSGRYRPVLAVPFEVGAGFGPSLGQAPGSADFRALALLEFAPEAALPPPDQDDDGVPDVSDICVRLRGQRSDDPLMNGCPAVPIDSDGDSVPDSFDACPRTPGEATSVRRTHGCPRAPQPPRPAAELVAQNIVISQQVRFETNTAILHAESDAVLSAVARVLNEHPELELVEVQGHTDETGTPELNQRLSEARASSVVAWLVAHGVAAGRLVARGYGRARPIADNLTDAGRAANRRVEFQVLKRARPEEPPTP